MNNKPLLSICCITYNHEKYIRDCINGFLMQKVSFPLEILIHDDASNDKTVEIIKDYQLKHPNIVKPFFQKENQYSKGVRGILARFLLPQAKGKYIALCEGDDYWTDPLKLQKQVDFLEANPDFTMCFHKVKILKNGQLIDDSLNDNTPQTTTIVDLAKGNFIRTLSVVFNKKYLNLPTWINECPVGDYPMWMTLASHGKMRFFNEVMGVYRHSDTSIWQIKKRYNQLIGWKKVLEYLLTEYFNEEAGNNLKTQYAYICFSLLNHYDNKDIQSKVDVLNDVTLRCPEEAVLLIQNLNTKVKVLSKNLLLYNSRVYKIGRIVSAPLLFLRKKYMQLRSYINIKSSN